jgi:hypothetical protein
MESGKASVVFTAAVACPDGLEHVAQGKEPRGMSSVSDTSAKKQGSQRVRAIKPAAPSLGSLLTPGALYILPTSYNATP